MDIIFINPNCLVDILKKSSINLGIIEYSEVYYYKVEDNMVKVGTDIYDFIKLEEAIEFINKYFRIKCNRFLINYLDFERSGDYFKKIIDSLKLNFNINRIFGDKYYLTINQDILDNKIDKNLYTLLNSNLFYKDNTYLVINEKCTIDMLYGKSNERIDIKDKNDIIDIIKQMMFYTAIYGRIELENRIKRIL